MDDFIIIDDPVGEETTGMPPEHRARMVAWFEELVADGTVRISRTEKMTIITVIKHG